MAQVKYIWPTRWSAVKMIYVANRYGNLAILAIANAQILGIWYEYTPSVSRPTITSSRYVAGPGVILNIVWGYWAQFCFRATLVLSLFQFASFAGVHGTFRLLGLHLQLLLNSMPFSARIAARLGYLGQATEGVLRARRSVHCLCCHLHRHHTMGSHFGRR